MQPQAEVAKLIRAELKRRGIPGSVHSKSFSMGNDVRVSLEDQPPDVIASLKEFCAPFERGHFDGMTDSYHYSNRRDDIPQTKYLFIDNHMSAAMAQAIWHWLKHVQRYREAELLPDLYSEAQYQRFGLHDCVDRMVWQTFNGSREGFWEAESITDADYPEVVA